MSNVPENVDPDTGEVKEGVTATVDFHDGRGPVNMDDTEEMEAGATEFMGKTLQLTLFEGHKVDLLELKLKGASIGGAVITPDVKVPRYHEVRYFIVEAKVCRITHHDKILGEDELLKKTAVFEIEAIAEADEFTAMRMLKKDGE